MRTFFVAFLLGLFINSNLFTEKLEVSDKKKHPGAIRSILPKGNDFYSLNLEYKSNQPVYNLSLFKNGKFISIPLVNSESNELTPHANSNMKLDNNGFLWISCTRNISKWNGNSWTSFSIMDKFDEIRDYSDFTFDKNDNIWIAALYDTVVVDAEIDIIGRFTEIIKFDQGKSEVIFHNYHKDKGDVFVYEKLSTSKNGNILITSNNLGNNDMLIFDGTDWSEQLLESYHGVKHGKNFNDFVEHPNGDLWFAYDLAHADSALGNSGGGLSVLKQNGDWKHFTDDDNYPFFANANDGHFSFPTDIEIDALGNVWVATDVGLLKINSDYELTMIDFEEIADDCIVYTSEKNPIPNFNIEDNYHRISNIAITDNGDVWFSILGDLVRYKAQANGINEVQSQTGKLYPNVINQGEMLTIEDVFTNNITELKLIDTKGSVVQHINTWTQSGGNITFTLNTNLTGKYWILGYSQDQNFLYPIIINK